MQTYHSIFTIKNQISVSFKLLFTIIRLLPTLLLLRQKTNFFLAISYQFGVLFNVLKGHNIGCKTMQLLTQKIRLNRI